jgi:hypothetical protein
LKSTRGLERGQSFALSRQFFMSDFLDQAARTDTQSLAATVFVGLLAQADPVRVGN